MHQALYRKYRPFCFDDVVGQSHVTKTLRAQSMSGRLSHAYLFCGPRGTGKTTCARILAKAANCLNPVNGDPCNQCEACRAINDGNATDVFEMDAATYTGVDDIRALRAEAVYSPSSLRKKVYIIDEVHMLSTSAFNAFLKILEEPPEHVMFVLASTELHKIPPTILSRCQRFEFSRITRNDIAGQLLKVAALEQIDLELGGAALIAAMSDGAMRNALSLLEQAAAQGGTKLNARAISGALGIATAETLFKVFGAIAEGNAQSAIKAFGDAYNEGAEPEAFFDQLLCLSRDVLMAANGIRGDVTGAGYSADDLSEFVSIPSERLYYIVKSVSSSLWSMPKSANKRVDGEMALFGLCTPGVYGDNGALAARVAALEKKLENGVTVVKNAEDSQLSPKVPQNEVKSTEKTLDEALGQAQQATVKPKETSETERFVLASSLMSTLENTLTPPAPSWLSFCTFQKQGNKLLVSTGDDMAYDWLNVPEILEEMKKAASALDGDIVTVKMELNAPSLKKNTVKKENNDNLDQLIDFMEQNKDISEFK